MGRGLADALKVGVGEGAAVGLGAVGVLRDAVGVATRLVDCGIGVVGGCTKPILPQPAPESTKRATNKVRRGNLPIPNEP